MTKLGGTVVDSVRRETGIDTLLVSRSKPACCKASLWI